MIITLKQTTSLLFFFCLVVRNKKKKNRSSKLSTAPRVLSFDVSFFSSFFSWRHVSFPCREMTNDRVETPQKKVFYPISGFTE